MLGLAPETKRGIYIANLKSAIRGRPARFSYDEATELFHVKEGENWHAFGDFRRGKGLYKRGLDYRAETLWKSYTLQNIEFSEEDVVIDCGANYADLWLTLKHVIAPENYITFEPGQREHAAIVQNAPEARANNCGLGSKNETLTFYLNEIDADSSFVEPASYSETLEAQTFSLESYLHMNAIERVKLFKLEAEGFEPEILQGALGVLDRIQYIAIDGGYERGVNCEQTFTHQTNLLTEHGFKMLDINLKWGRALFERIGGMTGKRAATAAY
ncbi:FkbM family methyltransferase [Yoonia sp. GPGPB17]|uniref:FkbM family methyltransferase n=1 Tax=Yoonia sp. GPGPB17 TaxID=3026147 RepID=UPI0030C4123C